MQNGSKIILNKGKNLSFFCRVLEIIPKLLYNAVVRRCDGMVDVLDSKSSVLWTWGFESPHRHHLPMELIHGSIGIFVFVRAAANHWHIYTNLLITNIVNLNADEIDKGILGA